MVHRCLRPCSIQLHIFAVVWLSLGQRHAFYLNFALMPILRKLLEAFDTNASLVDVPRGTCAVLAEAMSSVGMVGNRCDLTLTRLFFPTNGIAVSSFPRLKAADNECSKTSKQQVGTLGSCSRFFSVHPSMVLSNRILVSVCAAQECGPSCSLHFPLFRFVANMVVRVCGRRNITVHKLLDCVRDHISDRDSVPSALVLGLSWAEVALQAMVMVSQIKAGMWSRNGAMLPVQVRLFSLPRFVESQHDSLSLIAASMWLPICLCFRYKVCTQLRTGRIL